jgi:hypothetical protein
MVTGNTQSHLSSKPRSSNKIRSLTGKQIEFLINLHQFISASCSESALLRKSVIYITFVPWRFTHLNFHPYEKHLLDKTKWHYIITALANVTGLINPIPKLLDFFNHLWSTDKSMTQKCRNAYWGNLLIKKSMTKLVLVHLLVWVIQLYKNARWI